MLKILKIIVATIALIIAFNLIAKAQQKIEWNGYVQYRFTDNYLNRTNFTLRRTKFWLKGNSLAGEGTWNYKVQANFLQSSEYRLQLQDAMVSYSLNSFEVTAGQFVTDFSLQRKQSDYKIPLTERAHVINALVPGAETMARDIGIEFKFDKNETGSFSLGFFNGNGANTVSNVRNFLFVNHGYIYLSENPDIKFRLGYSLSYRDASSCRFTKILGSGISFSGKDFRFGLEELVSFGNLQLQSEYLEAHLGGRKASGFYALADYTVAAKNLVTFSVERLRDLNASTDDDPWYTIGYSYLLDGNNVKFSLDNGFQFVSDGTNYLTTMQVQYFFK